MDEEQGLASPLAGGIRAVRRTVSSSVFGGRQEPVQPQADPITTNLLQQNTLSLNNISGQLQNISSQVSGLNSSLLVIKDNLALSDTLDRQREAAKQNREAILAEQGLREGKESQIESRIQQALTFPVRRIAEKTQFGLSRLTNFFLILTGGWLTNTVVNMINANADGNVDLLNQLKTKLQRQLLIVGGTMIGIRLGLKKVLQGIGFISSSALQLAKGGLIKSPFLALTAGLLAAGYAFRDKLPSTGNTPVDVAAYATAGLTLLGLFDFLKKSFSAVIKKIPGGEAFTKTIANTASNFFGKKAAQKAAKEGAKAAGKMGFMGFLKGGLKRLTGKLGGPFVSFIINLITGEKIDNAIAGAIGFAAGAAVGQALIPIPFVGALFGGLLGEEGIKSIYKGIKFLLGFREKETEEVSETTDSLSKLSLEDGISENVSDLQSSNVAMDTGSVDIINLSRQTEGKPNNIVPVKNNNVSIADAISNIEEGTSEIVTLALNNNQQTQGTSGFTDSGGETNQLPNIGFDRNNIHTLFATSQYGANA